MAVLRANFLGGTITANLTNVATSHTMAGWANLPAVVAPNILKLTLGSEIPALGGAPEIVYVTAHTASSTTITIARAKEGTAARAHNAVTLESWRHAATTADFAIDWFPVGAFGGATMLDKIINAFVAAEAAGGGKIVMLPSGVCDTVTGLSLSGYSSVLRGSGTGTSILKASAQTGPVLDLDGWVSPTAFLGAPEFADFSIVGDGVGDATLANRGLNVVNVSQTSFRNIYITDCGGSGLYLGTEADLNSFENVVVHQGPDNAANDVPYIRLRGVCVGNKFYQCGIRNNAVAADALNCVVLESDGVSSAPLLNKFEDCWSENIHVPTGGRIVKDGGDQSIHRDWVHYDAVPVAAATDTAFMELASTGVATNNGGKEVTGHIPGCVSLHNGIVVSQSRNRIVGVKEYNGAGLGANVVLASGVQASHIELGGSVGTAGTGVIDNSGQNSNYIEDEGVVTFGGVVHNLGSGIAGLALKYAAAAGNPTLMLINSALKHMEIRLDDTTGQMIIDFWNGSGRVPDIFKLNVDGTLEIAGNLGVAAALVLAGKLVSVGAADSGGTGYALLRVPN